MNLRKVAIVAFLCINLATIGCATPQKTGAALQAVAVTAPTIAYQLNDVYKVLIAAKALPAYQAEATKALASLDAIAPMVQAQGAAIEGDKFNWASFVVQAAIAVAQVMGLWM
jgi:hypothetical protein